MKDRATADFRSEKAVAELHRVVEAVNAEISARRRATNDAAATKSNSRFITAKSARLSQAAGIARAGARQLAAAKSHSLCRTTLQSFFPRLGSHSAPKRPKSMPPPSKLQSRTLRLLTSSWRRTFAQRPKIYKT
jgi:hypothetical protein